MGGRHAAPQAHSTNVMCHVPAGTPTVPYARGGRPGRPSAPGVPGWLTAPTARPTWGGGPRAPAPTVPARRRRIAATGLTGLPRVWFPGGDFASTPGSAVVNPAEHPTSASTVESPSAPWNPPRPHSRLHQAPGSGSGLLERKWCKPRHGPRRSPWWVPPHWHEPDDGNCMGRGLLSRR